MKLLGIYLTTVFFSSVLTGVVNSMELLQWQYLLGAGMMLLTAAFLCVIGYFAVRFDSHQLSPRSGSPVQVLLVKATAATTWLGGLFLCAGTIFYYLLPR